MGTAIVDLVNKRGKTKTCRVLLDAGSQAHFITERVAQFLQLDRNPVHITVSGLGDSATLIRHSTSAIIKSRCNNFHKSTEFLIIPQISTTMPTIPMDPRHFEIPKNIPLADPEFYNPSTIDALIGVKLFYKLLSLRQIALKNQPNAVLQETQLGWIIAGEINPHYTAHIVCHLRIRANYLDFDLKRFSSLERRLCRESDLQRNYSAFLTEYQQLRHMSLSQNPDTTAGFYLPHHAVVRQDSSTTKTRVVFDGSSKTSTGISLNDTLMVGPKLQDDLFAILIRYRSFIYTLTADIEKMYRQIRVHPCDVIYQKILYRENSQSPVNTYVLDTVTYGTSCASYLAIKSL